MFRASDVNVSQPDIMSVSMGMREYGRGGDEDEDEDVGEKKAGAHEGVYITSWPGGA